MSLTSYRAAPPRGRVVRLVAGYANAAPGFWPVRRVVHVIARECDKRGFVLGRPGDDLLSRVLRHSTIGAEAFNGRVRDGIGFRRLAQATGPAKDKGQAA